MFTSEAIMETTSQGSGAAPAAMTPDGTIFQILNGKMTLFALGGVARLGVADHVTDQARPVEELAAACHAHAPSLYRAMRLLATVGVFEEHPGRRFAATPATQLLRSTGPSLRDMVLMVTDPWSVQSYQQMTHCLQTGRNGVTAAFGKQLFELLPDDPVQRAHFHGAMSGTGHVFGKALLKVADFSRFRRMADVGGGHGLLLGLILNRFPSLEGVLFDLLAVVAGAPGSGYLRGVENRVTIEGGSFVETIPVGCDAYIMKFIIHDWDDDNARRILTRAREQLATTAPETGRVFLVEMVVPDDTVPHFSKYLDIEMLICAEGGRERTAGEFGELLAAAGLRLRSVTPTPSPMSLIEAEIAE
jgi:hypothetical protein